MLFSLLVGAALAADPCDVAASTADIDHALDQAETAWSQSDLPALTQATDRARSLVPCLTEPVTRSLAARVHRDLGLRAFVERDLDRAELSFAAARSVQPEWRFPETMVPAGNPLHDHYLARSTDGLTTPVDSPEDGTVTFDGREGTARPTGRPTLVQVFSGGGGVLASALLEPGDPMPEHEKAAPATVLDAETAVPPERRGPQLALGIGAGVSALTAGTLLVVSRTASGRFHDESITDEDQLRGLRSTANSTLAASAGLGLVSLGLGVGFVVVR